MLRQAPLILAALSFALPAAAQFSASEAAAASEDSRAFTIDETTIDIETVGPASPPEAAGIAAASAAALPILDSIVNLSGRIGKVIVDNKPVVDVKTQYASALPEGIASWAQMAGWEKPKGTIYRLTAKNLYGIRVIDLRYQVLRTAGGSYEGKGKYLTAVTVEPLFLEVAWGYRFTLDANVPDSGIVNVGTSGAPIAAMTAHLGWRISTAVKDTRGQGIYYLQGDGAYLEIGGPFKRPGLDRMKASIAETMGETLSYGQ